MKNSRVKNVVGVCLLLGLFFEVQAISAVQISQVLYAPIGSNSGGEAVELYNEADEQIDMSGWYIRTETSEKDAVFPSGTVLAPRSRFLVADVGWNSTKDNHEWRSADLEETITLSNTDAGVALVDASNQSIDAVGWGRSEQIRDGLYEGTPLDANAIGACIRLTDTHNNSHDFVAALPAFGHGTPLVATVSRTMPAIEHVLVEDDIIEDEGVQWVPMPGSIRHMQILINQSGVRGSVHFDGHEYALVMNGSVSIARVNISGTTRPGEYVMTIGVGDVSVQRVVRVLPVKGLEVQAGIIRLVSDESSEVEVRNIGNVEFIVAISSSNLSSGHGMLAPQALKFSTDDLHFFAITSNWQQTGLAITPATSQKISVLFDPDEDTPSGIFTGSLRVSAQ